MSGAGDDFAFREYVGSSLRVVLMAPWFNRTPGHLRVDDRVLGCSSCCYRSSMFEESMVPWQLS
jgi:hypothetical protein